MPEVVFKRLYLEDNLLAHVIGYVGSISESDLKTISTIDPILQIPDFQIGKVGVESYDEACLDEFMKEKMSEELLNNWLDSQTNELSSNLLSKVIEG